MFKGKKNIILVSLGAFTLICGASTLICGFCLILSLFITGSEGASPGPTEAMAIQTLVIDPTATPLSAETSLPTNTPLPTNTSTPLPTDTPLPTSTSIPKPTATTESTPIIDISRARGSLFSLGYEEVNISADFGEVQVVVNTTPTNSFGEGIGLAYDAELNIYLIAFALLDEIKDLDEVTIELQFDGQTAYEVNVSREQAYDFYPHSFRTQDYQSYDPKMLASAGLEVNLINHWDILYMAPEIEAAITNPSRNDIEFALEKWITADILELSIAPATAVIRLDISYVANMFIDAYGENDSITIEQIELQAGLNTIDPMYGLFIRFPIMQMITVETYLNGEHYSAYVCTRELFNQIGPGSFDRAGAEGHPEDILPLLSSP
jgi:hypothetical protein